MRLYRRLPVAAFRKDIIKLSFFALEIMLITGYYAGGKNCTL
jgi:hypothetical protein